jgi:hypothetical protein
MTKAQLITALQAKYPEVETDSSKWIPFNPTYQFLNYSMIRIPVMDGSGEVKWDNAIVVWKNGDDYYWQNGEPKTVHFRERLITFINSKVVDGTIQFGVIKDANDDLTKATVQVYMPDNSLKLLLVTETTPGTFTFKVIA